MIENHLKTIETPSDDLVGEVKLDFSCNFVQHAINKCDLEAGMCSHSANTIQGPRKVDWHVVWFMLEGELECITEKQKFTIKKGDVVISPANVERTHISEHGFHWFWMKCLKPDKWNIQGDQPYHYQLKTKDALPNLISLIRNEMKEDLRSPVMGNLLEVLPVLATREFDYAPTLEDPQRKRLSDLFNEVRLSPAEKWNIDVLAEKSFVSKGYLHQLVQKYYNCSPMEKITRIRIECAEELLLSTGESLEQLALQVGYGSATAFSNAFYKAKQIRPGDYRSKALLR